MGDAVMASFCSAADAAAAAADMLDEISAFNAAIEETGNHIGLKIGLHLGPVIAVKANQTLDYFGQTVNISARVQGLADSGEICLTEEIMNGEISGMFEKRGFSISSDAARLKGVDGNMTVYRCRTA